MNEFEIQGRTIYKAARETKHDNGLSSFTLSFPVCEVSEWIKEPEQVLDILNSHDQLRAQLAERDKTIERLRDALTPSVETKAAYIGEFNFPVRCTDPEYGDEYTLKCDVPWTAVKEIMKAIRERAALQENADE